jgi:hypothetical protein
MIDGSELLNDMSDSDGAAIADSLDSSERFSVVFDRHFFFDYYTDHVAGGAARPFRRRVHGFLLSDVYPRPDLVIYLDAPPEMLFERKGEGTVEWLERRKTEYIAHASAIDHFVWSIRAARCPRPQMPSSQRSRRSPTPERRHSDSCRRHPVETERRAAANP